MKYRLLSKHLRSGAAITIIAGSLISCTPLIHNHGYVFSQESLAKIETNKTNMQSVREIMGSPTTISSNNGMVYYYISSVFVNETYKKPREIDRRIAAIYFDQNDVVSDMGFYGLADGNIVAFIERRTSTSGKELSLLAQMFGNLGRFDGGQGGAPSAGGR